MGKYVDLAREIEAGFSQGGETHELNEFNELSHTPSQHYELNEFNEERVVFSQLPELNELNEKSLGYRETTKRIQPYTRGPIPDAWRDGVARFMVLPSPDDVLPARWRTLQSDALRFLETWSVQAAALGWTAHDLFGCNRVKPLIRLDGAGLVRLLDGRSVVVITEAEAVIACRTGSRQTFRRKSAAVLAGVDQVLLWEIIE